MGKKVSFKREKIRQKASTLLWPYLVIGIAVFFLIILLGYIFYVVPNIITGHLAAMDAAAKDLVRTLMLIIFFSFCFLLILVLTFVIFSYERKRIKQAAIIEYKDRELETTKNLLKIPAERTEIGGQEVKAIEERYRSFLQNFKGIAFRGDLDFKPIFFHGAVEEITGYAESDFIRGRHAWDEIILPEDIEMLHKQGSIENLRKIPGYSTQREYRIRKRNGVIVWIFEQIHNVTDSTGKIRYVQGVLHDITKQKEVEQELEQSEARYKTLFQESADGVLIAEIGTKKLKYANPAICKMLGYSEQELLQLGVEDIHPKAELAKILDNFNKQAQGLIYLTSDIPCLRKDGEIIIVDISARSTIIDGIRCNIGLFRDMTERKKITDELIKAQKLESLGILAGGIAHDFNNLLNGIFGYLDLIRDSCDQDDEINEYCEKALSAYSRAKDLTQQLLTFSKGGLPKKKLIDIEKISKETVIISLSGSKIFTKYSFDPKLWKIEADEGQIAQVISNLAINARQAMPEGGIVKITAENVIVDDGNNLFLKAGAYVRISIKDQGQGIARNIVHKIFDPFFTTKKGGSGLGLTTAYSIVKKHEGQITVTSEIGQGTIFEIYLPAITEDLEISADKESLIAKGSGRILVMDDEEIVLDFLKDGLLRLGYEVITSYEGKEAVDLYKKASEAGRPFNIVILDLTVPAGMGGEQTLIELLKIDPHIKAIVSSGYSGDDIISRYKEFGFKGAVSKPYRINELSQVIRSILNE
jgi:two-component system cell cycle sensor histidine kinase/response regulator CckA